MYILDASVVLKWFLEEKGSELALELRQSYISGLSKVVLPDLILYEVANALRYDKKFSQGAATEAIISLIDLGIDIIVPTTNLLRGALEIAYENGVTVYDAIYISLAQEMSCEFITADEKLYRKVKNFNFVKLLNETPH